MSKKYISTITVPTTTFPMQANLRSLEPTILDRWQTIKLNELITTKKTNKTFVLEYGPPFANGDFHLGHALNINLKDMILRFKNTIGYQVKNIIGFDCHGLPIETKVCANIKSDPNHIAPKTALEGVKYLRSECWKFAHGWIEKQTRSIDNIGLVRNPHKIYNTHEMTKEIYKAFSKILLGGNVYVETKPVLWSIHPNECTVIADVDLDYRNKISKSVYVALEIVNAPYEGFIGNFLVIWTTTPWSLMDNVCVGFNEDLNYTLIAMSYDEDGTDEEVEDILQQRKEHMVIVAEAVADEFIKMFQTKCTKLATVSGKSLHGMEYRHPITDELMPVVHAAWVDSTVGTGLVHIAPAHGEVDFALCTEHGIKVMESVNEEGYYLNSCYKLGGKHIFHDEEEILDALSGKLLHIKEIEHSYPYSTRTGTPLIYRAMKQVFIKVNNGNLERLLKDVNIYPNNLKPVFLEVLNKRPEWCISRNRFWGVPMGLLVYKYENLLLLDEQVQEKIIAKMDDPNWCFVSENLLSLVDERVRNDYEPYIGILEVWFDSGAIPTFMHNYDEESGEFHEADLYLEGKDQTRGWFQSTLRIGDLIYKKSPYKNILCHGFLTDEQGRKMSKSLGNGISLDEILQDYGREIFRILVITSDYYDDVKVGKNLLNTASETYRKIRNVMRYLISVVHNHTIMKPSYITELDGFILTKLENLINNYMRKVETYDMRGIFDELFSFIQYISSVYFNAMKTLLYCGEHQSPEYNSALYTFSELLRHLNLMLAPILPFTCEEIFMFMDGYHSNLPSIHLMELKPVFYDMKTVDIHLLDDLIYKINVDVNKALTDGVVKKRSHFICLINKNELLNISSMTLEQLLQMFVKAHDEPGYKLVVGSQICGRCFYSSNSMDTDLCHRCIKVAG